MQIPSGHTSMGIWESTKTRKESNLFTYSKIEDQQVGGVSHVLIQNYYKDHQKISKKSKDDDQREQSWNKNWDNLHQDQQVLVVNFCFALIFGQGLQIRIGSTFIESKHLIKGLRVRHFNYFLYLRLIELKLLEITLRFIK